MTNTFIPTLNLHPLYCVWITTGNPSHPLDRVWIDPELRRFVHVETSSPICESNIECEPEAQAKPLPEEGLFARQFFTSVREEMKVKARSAMKTLSWVVVVLCLVLNTAWADVAGRVSG